LLIDRHPRRWKTRICKGTDRHGDEPRQRIALPAHGGAAVAAKPKPGDAAAVAGLGVFPALPLDRHRIRREPRLRAEHAARALLAREAMADRDPYRLAARADDELSTAACCLTIGHGSGHLDRAILPTPWHACARRRRAGPAGMVNAATGRHGAGRCFSLVDVSGEASCHPHCLLMRRSPSCFNRTAIL
jgi:hypothetical protein